MHIVRRVPPPCRAIIFDKDRTLYSADRMTQYCCDTLLECVRRTTPMVQLTDLRFMRYEYQQCVDSNTWEVVLKRMARTWTRCAPIDMAGAFSVLMNNLPEDRWRFQQPIARINPLLTFFARDRGIRIALYTDDTRLPTDSLLCRDNITQCFTAILCADDPCGGKDSDRGIPYLLAQLNCDPRDTWIVGDTATDMGFKKRHDLSMAVAIGEKVEYADIHLASVEDLVPWVA